MTRANRLFPSVASLPGATILFALLACSPPAQEAQPREQPKNSADKIEAYLDEHHVPGASVAVMHQGQLVWSKGFGLADLEHRVAVSSATKFRVGSISKTLTSVAVALLWEQDKLDLDAPVQRYVSSFPDKRYPITTRQLAGHLSGLPHYNEEDFINEIHYESVTDALRKFRHRDLQFEPGERFSYSSFGWNLISAVVEGASGAEFLSYMQEMVFAPLKMHDTAADHYAQIIEHRTEFYRVSEEGDVFNATAIDNSDVWAGGGFLSTAEDLVRFADGVMKEKLLRPETVKLLITPMTTTDGESTGYGLGWRVWEIAGRRAVGHSGGHVGATAELIVLPEESFALAILTNSGNAGLRELAEELVSSHLDL